MEKNIVGSFSNEERRSLSTNWRYDEVMSKLGIIMHFLRIQSDRIGGATIFFCLSLCSSVRGTKNRHFPMREVAVNAI
jgi:hypothetical protein